MNHVRVYHPVERTALAILLFVGTAPLLAQEAAQVAETTKYETITFPSIDGLQISADLYRPNADPYAPFIVLCHQAGWSRGEYREIAPKLGKLGFNCLAIDQRSGKAVGGVDNESVKRAEAAGKGVAFLDAEQDIIAAARFARKNYRIGKLLLWGSSYSSALVLRIAGEHPQLADGVLAFAPGEYFGRFGKPENWIAQSAAKIKIPAFITSAKNEGPRWKTIYDAIPGENKAMFLPQTAGNHGSRALWEKFSDHHDYWQAVTSFLDQF